LIVVVLQGLAYSARFGCISVRVLNVLLIVWLQSTVMW